MLQNRFIPHCIEHADVTARRRSGTLIKHYFAVMSRTESMLAVLDGLGETQHNTTKLQTDRQTGRQNCKNVFNFDGAIASTQSIYAYDTSNRYSVEPVVRNNRSVPHLDYHRIHKPFKVRAFLGFVRG